MTWSSIRWISIRSKFVRWSMSDSLDTGLRLEKDVGIPLPNGRWTGSRCAALVQECPRIQHGKLQCNEHPTNRQQKAKTFLSLSLWFQIYEDSIILQSVFTNARERMEKGEIPISSNSEGESDDDGKSTPASISMNTLIAFAEPLKKRVKKDTHMKKVMKHSRVFFLYAPSLLCRNLWVKHGRPVMEVWAVERVVAKLVWWVTKKIPSWMRPIRFVHLSWAIAGDTERFLFPSTSHRTVGWTTTRLKMTTWTMKALVVRVHDKNEHVEILFAVCLSHCVRVLALLSSVCVSVCVFCTKAKSQGSNEREQRDETLSWRSIRERTVSLCNICMNRKKQQTFSSLLSTSKSLTCRLFSLVYSFIVFVFSLSLSLTSVLFSSMMRLDFFVLISYCSFLR